MAKYVLLIGNGNAAASRGMDKETLYTFHVGADSIDDTIDKAQNNIREMDRFDDYEDVVEEELELTYHEYFNDKDPSGGDVWLVAYLEDGKLVDCCDLEKLKSGEDSAYEFNKPEDAKLFGMEPYVRDKYGETDEEEFAISVDKILEERFLGEEFEIQVDGGGAGPSEWYSEDMCEVIEIYYDDGKVEVSLERSVSEPDEDAGRGAGRKYESMNTEFYATIDKKEFGIDDTGTHEQIIELFKTISKEKFERILYHNVKY